MPERGESYVRSIAGSFLFSGDDVEKKVGVLSGGERARVALAKLLLMPANLLIMDEPTNHLDLDSSEALIEALKQYGGTLLFVSHNRSFINQLATQVWDVQGSSITPHPGNLDDYFYHLRQAEARQAASDKADKADKANVVESTAGAVSEKERRRKDAEERAKKSARAKPIKDAIAKLEQRIAVIEAEQKQTERALADPDLYNDYARARPFMDSHRDNKEKLEELYARWEHQQELLAALPGD